MSANNGAARLYTLRGTDTRRGAVSYTRRMSLDDIRADMARGEGSDWQPDPGRVAGLARWLAVDVTPGIPEVTRPRSWTGLGQWRQGWMLDKASPAEHVFTNPRTWASAFDQKTGATPLAGLGLEPSSTPRDAALRAYVRLSKQAQAQGDYLAGARPADWAARLDDTYNILPSLFQQFEQEVRGKTGDAEAERALLALLTGVNARLREAEAQRPGMLSAAADAVARWLTDFTAGAAAPVTEFAAWAAGRALPYLRRYAAATEAMASNMVPEGKRQEVAAALSGLRAAFATASGGGSLDELAEQVRQRGALGVVWTPFIIAGFVAIVVLALGGSLGLWDLLKGVGKTGGEGIGWGLGVAAVVAAFLLLWPKRG